MSLIVFSPAKINLFLHITAKRDDGYHDLQSVFRAIDFGDVLSFEPSPSQVQLVTLTGADTLTDDINDNLIIKAAKLLSTHHPDQARAVSIHLDKVIPTGAGLGGGSSNCAATLMALNTLWQLDLSTEQLMDFGQQLGADVPFFIFSQAHHADAHALGIGERLDALRLPSARYLLLLPRAHLATAALFNHPDLIKNTQLIPDIADRYSDYGERLSVDFFNAFERIAAQHSAAVAEALSYLHTLEAKTGTSARLTGTGSTVFLPIPEHIDAATLSAWQLSSPCPCVVAESLY